MKKPLFSETNLSEQDRHEREKVRDADEYSWHERDEEVISKPLSAARPS